MPIQGGLAVRALPEVTVVDGPVPVRIVGSRIDLRVYGHWQGWLGDVDQVGATASWNGKLFVTTVETSDRDIPGPGMCGAAATFEWTIWRFDHGHPVALVDDSADTCSDWHACSIDDDLASCRDLDGAYLRCWTLDPVAGTATATECPGG